MDRKSLFIGMGLGAGIALVGMLLGAQGRVNRPDAEFRRLTVEEIRIVPRGGARTMMEISANQHHGEISTYNMRGQRLVRIGAILQGGGAVTTYENEKPMVIMASSARGGDVLVKSPTGNRGSNAARLTATPDGGVLFMYDDTGTGLTSSLAPAEGGPEFILRQPSGEAGVTLRATSEGGEVSTHDSSGEVKERMP